MYAERQGEMETPSWIPVPVRALVLEQDDETRAQIVRALKERGHDVREFRDGKSALEAHLQRPFRILLLEWRALGMDGLEVTRRVRASPGGDVVSILVLMDSEGYHSLDKILDAGANDYLTKPLDMGRLPRRILVAERVTADRLRRKEAEAKLRRSEADLTALIENTNDAVWSVDVRFRIITTNSVARNLAYMLFGVEVAPGLDVIQALPEPRRARVRATYERAFGGRHFTRSWRIVTQGAELHLEASFNPIRNADGSVRGVSVFARNVSDRLQTEEALRRSQRDFRQLIEAAPDGVVILRDRRLVYVNQTFAHMVGRDPDELVGHRLTDFFHPDDRGMVLMSDWRRNDSVPPRIELRALQPERKAMVVEALPGAGIDFDGVPAQVVSIRDITDRKKIEAQLVMTDRLASMGTLAAGVAHEINNPLGYLSANLEFLEENVADLGETIGHGERGELTEALREARQGANQVRRIVSDLKQFSRVDDEQLGPIDVRAVLESAIQMTANELRHRARLIRDIQEVPLAHANAGRLSQVLVNLLTNAAQALDDKSFETNAVTVRVVPCSMGVRVEVEDNGPGISEDVRSRMFDPFFTTKEVGEGTGLGLSICHSIVTGFGGSIRVDSEVGRGTIVRVELLSDRAVALPVQERTTTPMVHADRLPGRILVIDDEPLVGQSFRRALAAHDVVVTESGREALGMLQEQEFDVVFCDLMMPEVSGMDFFETLRSDQPELCERVVFMTGGAFTPRAQLFVETVDNVTLTKPFEMDSVRRLVQNKLQKSDL